MTAETPKCANCHAPLPPGSHFCNNCGAPTPTEPGVPERTMPTGAIEVSRVRKALASSYRIEHVLGEGGMATVYLAEDLKHHRKVAIKVMRADLAETLGADRFLREIEIAAKLSHPHILPVYDSGSADGVLYYVMPVVEGESLPARLKREKQLPVGEAIRLAREVAQALAYAHKRGIVHRDIKPANILLSDGQALVADFGIARATGTGTDGQPLTQTGLAIGTPHYMSPEQASGDSNIDGRSDIYALGCVLYELLSGEPPFTGPTAQVIITRSLTEQPRSLSATRQAISPALNAAVLKALAKTPADRYHTATEMAEALELANSDQRTPAPPRQAAGANRRSPFAVACGVVVVLALGAFGWKRFGPAPAAAANSVAVLPFRNQGDSANAYFAEGIVDEVRDRLSGLDNFTVIASASADQYRDTDKTPQDIARELRVDQVLMGSVRWSTDASGKVQFRVSAELIDGRTGKLSWRESFDGTLDDPFAIEGRIATQVASALGATVSASQTNSLTGRPTNNVEAYDAYLKGRAIVQGASAEGARQKAQWYERAVALDSNFVRAWASLATANILLWANGTRQPEVAQRAKDALDRLVKLAPDSAVTHGVLASYYATVERNPEAARRASLRTLELAPNDARTLANAAGDDIEAGDAMGAREKLLRARSIDPLNQVALGGLVQAHLMLGQYDEARAISKELYELGPEAYDRRQWIALAHIAAGDEEGAKRLTQELARRGSVTEMVANYAGYQELSWLFDTKDIELLFRLTPAQFDGDRAWWGQSLANAAWQQGDKVRARAYAESSLVVARQQIERSPDDPQLRILNAVSLAHLGRKSDAIREADLALADTAGIAPYQVTYILNAYAKVLMIVGEQERAIDVLEYVLERRTFFTPGYLRADPTYHPLKGHPRFERLANRGIGAPVD